MAVQDKKFVGNVSVKDTQFGEIVKIGFTKEHLEMLMAELKGGWVNVDILNSQKGGKYAVINDFVADSSKGGGKKQASAPASNEKNLPPIANQGQADDDDLPF